MKSLASSKKVSADFSSASVRLPCVFFANRGSGLRHAFFVSVILPVTCDGLDPLLIGIVLTIDWPLAAVIASGFF